MQDVALIMTVWRGVAICLFKRSNFSTIMQLRAKIYINPEFARESVIF